MADVKCIPASKTCSLCLIEKALCLFYKCPSGKFGHRAQCRACEDVKKKAWQANNKEKVYKSWAASKRRSMATPDGRAAQQAIRDRYRVKNKDKINAYQRERRLRDPVARIAAVMRSSLQRILTQANKRKDAKCEQIHGYTRAELKTHIEKQFTKGMRWELVGPKIEIDHIVPVSEFFRLGEHRPEVISALSNLKPIWSEENRKKRDQLLYLI